MDKIFKIGLLILGTSFLLLYYFTSQNNRYVLRTEGNSITVFDTRKGIIYVTGPEAKGKTVIINLIEARTEVKDEVKGK